MKFEPKKTVFLIDGSSFLYRGYYSLRPLHTKQGTPVQAVYSFCRMIKKLADTFEPQYMALVWDSKGPTVRHELYPEYKATRQAPPTDLFQQKELIIKFADLIGLKNVATPGVEADDLLYALAIDQQKKDMDVVLITSDKDMAQALTQKVHIFDPFKGQFLEQKSFEEKMGFSIQKLPFFYALIGDASDNIPGVRGIGPKGATELVQQFDSLEQLYTNISHVKKERTRLLLTENKKNAFLSEKLFRLHYYDTKTTTKDFSFSIDNWHKARPLFQELEFKSLLKDLEDIGVQTSLIPMQQEKKLSEKYTFIAVTTTQALKTLCAELQQAGAFALDTETTGLRPLQDSCVGVSLCYTEGTSYYVPFGHITTEQQIPYQEALTILKPILEDVHIKKYLFHTKFDQLVLLHCGITTQNVVFDAHIAANLLAKEWERKGLKDLSSRYFNETMLTYDEIVKNNKYKNFAYVPLALATEYAAADAHQTLKLSKKLMPEIQQEGLGTLFYECDMPLSQLLIKMEYTGIFVDTKILADLDKKVSHDLAKLIADISALVDVQYATINLSSPKQISELLFQHLKLPTQKKSAKGTAYSTDYEVLQELAKIHPVPGLILKYRELYKLKSTYIDALPTYINPETKKIHTTFSQSSVATGRLASYDPNLQNIPTDSAGYGIEIRAAFKPDPGYVFLSADYSQIELRVLAYFSGDRHLTEAFLSGHDIHAQTAARLFDIPPTQVTNEQRQLGKRINFSILYGLTPFGLSKDLHIPFNDAKIYIERYFAQYPGVAQWMETVIEETKKNGYVTTLWGKRRYVPGIYERNKSLYELARRIAINTKAQGTAAEIMKFGMINLDNAFVQHKLGAQILLQIHDELLIQVPEHELEKTEHLVKQVLESVVTWQVPLVVTTRHGRDWKEVTK